MTKAEFKEALKTLGFEAHPLSYRTDINSSFTSADDELLITVGNYCSYDLMVTMFIGRRADLPHTSFFSRIQDSNLKFGGALASGYEEQLDACFDWICLNVVAFS
jgi:hypothetical protein